MSYITEIIETYKKEIEKATNDEERKAALDKANEALKGTGIQRDPEKNVIKPGEAAVVCEDVLCLLDGVQAVDVSLAGVHDVAQVLVFLCQFNISLLVGDYVRVGDECRHFFVSAFKTIQLL